MYILKHYCGHLGHSTLVEMTAQELREETAEAEANATDAFHIEFERIGADRAHRWVKSGGHHGTHLYWDAYAQRIRYARDK